VSPSAWLALDAQDDAPGTFLHYVVAALRGIDPAIGAQVAPLLELSDAVPPQALIGTLLNDLAAMSHDSVLVLDDLHVLTHPAIYDALAYLLDHIPPRLHLVLLTREDPPLPLARLRARRQLVEVRAADLRFTLAEADAFLHEAMHLALDTDTTAALVGRSEGWIVGLQLAALSLRDLGAEDVAAAINAFTGNNRYVVDYLVDEVIRAQPAHLQHFLLQTSILDRLCGSLCDAILGLEARDARLE
jgi:ATP/maltotriose-dependent transcriptional regulator MalT